MKPDLSTRYLGLRLAHPLIASASPLTSTCEGMCALEEAGAAAVVMRSLFEAQVQAEDTAYTVYSEHGSYSQAEAGSYFPELPSYDKGVSGHLQSLRNAVEAVNIPIIASLNAVSLEGWVDYAMRLEAAGAAALELNAYFIPGDFRMSGRDVESHYIEVVSAVKRSVSLPVSVKLSPHFSSIGHMAHQLVDAGADGLVLFNRFYQPDFDLATLSVKSDLKLSSAQDTGPALLWIALLSARLRGSLAATSGVETVEQVVKYLLVGADAVMTTSALLRHGATYMRLLVAGLRTWLDEHGHASVAAIRGLRRVTDVEQADVLLRAQYMTLLTDYVPGRLAA